MSTTKCQNPRTSTSRCSFEASSSHLRLSITQTFTLSSPKRRTRAARLAVPPCETAVVAVWTMVAVAIDPIPLRPIWTPALCPRLVVCHPCRPAGSLQALAAETSPEDHPRHHEVAAACRTPTIPPMADHLNRTILRKATADPTPTDGHPQGSTAAPGAVVEDIEEEEATAVLLAINVTTTLPGIPVEEVVVAMVATSLLLLLLLLSTGCQPTKSVQPLWDRLYGHRDTRVLALGFL